MLSSPSTSSSDRTRTRTRTRMGWPAAAALALALCLPAPARAGLTLAGSLGYGHQVAPTVQPEAANLMVSLGYDFFGFVRPELGVVGGWEAVRRGDPGQAGLEIRPMVVLGVPLLPLYLRLVGAAVQPFTPAYTFAYGGSLGVALALMGVGAFAEVGVLPRERQQAIAWVLEARAGVSYAF